MTVSSTAMTTPPKAFFVSSCNRTTRVNVYGWVIISKRDAV